jgi:excinuclease ABC subunit C
MLQEKLKLIPHLPGSYQYYDETGTIIYVGKAKDLHKRVNSYFNRPQTGKTAILVSEIRDLTYIVASSETEAFLLEINLIKKHDPKYNILLKDDKTYPYIEYVRVPFPALKVSRYTSVRKKDKLLLFGPYPNAYAARRIVKLLNRLYPLKKCEHMPKEVCLYYSIGECLGYCAKKVDPVKLKAMEDDILGFLRGNDKILRDKLMNKIEEYSSTLNFEAAKDLKEELQYIDIVLTHQKIELHDYVNRDVIAYQQKSGFVCIEILFIRNGKLIGSHNNIFYVVTDLKDEISSYLLTFYENHENPSEILICEDLNVPVLSELIKSNFVIPQKGKKKDLIDMAYKNAKVTLDNELITIMKNEERTLNANDRLASILGIKSLHRIEIFDNSNLFGSFSVSGMVVFINGLPAKKEYRKYKISQEKNDDYNTMKEVIYRRYYRVLVDSLEHPDLIIVDGGINQINAAKETLNSLNLNIPICGLKKDNHHRTNQLINASYETINLDNDSNVFLYLTRMQDEVHRYTINYHREIRSKGAISSVLDDIDGIGKERKHKLIKKYGNLKKINEASVEELSEIIPQTVAEELKKYLTAKFN